MGEENTILVIKGYSEYDVLREASDRVCRGFVEKGYKVRIFDILEEAEKRGNEFNIELEIEMSKSYAFVFLFRHMQLKEVCRRITPQSVF